MLRWAKAMKIDLSGLEDIERFYERMFADDSVNKALHAEGLER